MTCSLLCVAVAALDLPARTLKEALVADQGRRHRLKLAARERARDSASSDCASFHLCLHPYLCASRVLSLMVCAATVSWSESETDPDVDERAIRIARQKNLLSRVGRRHRNKVQAHMDPEWHKLRAGTKWLEKSRKRGAGCVCCRRCCRCCLTFCVCVCACVVRNSSAENTNWDDPTINSVVGRKAPPKTVPGNSSMDCPPQGPYPVVPPLPVLSQYAPDGDDTWDGEIEPVDRDPDGYVRHRRRCLAVLVTLPVHSSLHDVFLAGTLRGGRWKPTPSRTRKNASSWRS